MQIINKDEYKNVPISALEFSTRTFNALMRASIDNLYLLIECSDALQNISNLGAKSLQEIENVLSTVSDKNFSETEESTLIEDDEQLMLPENVLSRSASDLHVSNRVLHAFEIAGINTVEQVCLLNETEIMHMKNMGVLSCKQLIDEIKLLKKLGEVYFSGEFGEDEEKVVNFDRRELDIDTVKKLQESYGFKTIWLCDWYSISRQRVYQKLEKRVNKGKWNGKELLGHEREVINSMINDRCFYKQADQKQYYFLNNMQDDCAVLIVSEEDIKCFYLKDLADALQARIKYENLHKLSENEVNAYSDLGRTVSILKKHYFMPTDSSLYRNLASARNMTNEEYSLFLYKLPYCTAQASITDERIIEFLQDNTVDGRTFISSTPDTQWIRSFISRNGFTINSFIQFYGFNTEADSDRDSLLEFDIADIETVERDMRVYANEGNYIEKLYAETPLLGSRIISQKNIEIINQNSRKLLVKILNNPGSKPSLSAEMQIALAVINYAKGWDTEDESGFWRYITAQFGYRDDSGQLRSLLCKCVKDALVKNNRWFVTNSGGNMYKSSIMVHAFSTKRSWLHFCDFLFDFYKTNLEWEYVENDPMFARMIYALRNKFNISEDVQDEDIQISTKIYYFREGIVKLVLQRPQYATHLVESIVRRLDALINHTANQAVSYEEKLCDEWMEQKIQGLTIKKQKDSSAEKRVIAIDYTRIKPVYRLHNESEIFIVFPDVRLEKNEFTTLNLTILNGSRVIEQRSLSYYGNELGKTMSGFSIGLDDYLRKSCAAAFEPQVVIKCDTEEIYNSGKSLFRKVLAFRDKAEVDINNCEKGGYSIFIPKDVSIEYSNAEVSPIKETSFYIGYYTEFRKDFTLNIDSELIAYDNSDGDALRIVVPNSKHNAEYVVDGRRYRIMDGSEVLHIISPDKNNEKKYQVAINDKVLYLDQLTYEESGEARVYKIEMGNLDCDEVSLRMLDFENNRLIIRRYFKIIPSFNYRFNRTFYFSDEDYREAKLRVIFSDSAVREYPITKADTYLTVPFQAGEVEIPVPCVKFFDNHNEEWKGAKVLWKNDIPQDRFLYAKIPSGVNVSMMLDDEYIGTEDNNSFAIGNAVTGYSNIHEKKWLGIYAVILAGKEEKKYDLGKIALQEQFIENPKLSVKDDVLFWNLGYGFIGDAKSAFKIKIGEGTAYETVLPLDLNEEKITDGIRLPLGEYQYSIVKQSGNLFSMQLQEVAAGNFFVGDENELRFLKHLIQIDTITFEEDDAYDAVKIKTCYIDHIEYKGIHYVGSEDRECPIYNGILFFISPSGKRHEYSYEDTRDEYGHQLYQINPVRIVYINETTLSITQETGGIDEPGDGFYYYRYFDKYEMKNIYQLTDWEPTRFNQDKYYLADLYSYIRKEGKENV